MRRSLVARVAAAAACCVFAGSTRVSPAGAQEWNDARSRAIVDGAIQRRAEQLADTALRDYQATAHGYLTFLAQMGEGFRTPPKVIKADELDVEVYWKAPSLSKQIVVGRRDTLLLPTDIAYHHDHLGIVQNNFPDLIRLGEGDEVKDVPHPLSRAGLLAYDFALSDSFAIGSGSDRIHVYEIKVRPKDDTQPRVVGAVYVDPAAGQVVRMNFAFTRAAFLDKALEEITIVLENRLVGGRFWLPSVQQVEIERNGEWLDYPARGIIRGRWDIGEYKFNLSPAPTMFLGEEYVQAPPSILAQHQWTGRILDSLPPDVRAVTEPEIARVQEQARELVRARALAAAQHATLSARNVSDFARFDRAEGLALGAGTSKVLGSGLTTTLRARYGLDDAMLKGSSEIAHVAADGSAVRAFARREYRDVGDVAERSSVVNTLAAQEFGSDDTDPFLERVVGLRYELPRGEHVAIGFTASYGIESPVAVRATPVTGVFAPKLWFNETHATRLGMDLDRPASEWIGGTELSVHGTAGLRWPYQASRAGVPDSDDRSVRGAVRVGIDRAWGAGAWRLSTTQTVAGVHFSHPAEDRVPVTELIYLGGPISAPGYDYHSIVATVAYTAHVELLRPAPFPGFGIGRYGRVPSEGRVALFAHAVVANRNHGPACVIQSAGDTCPLSPSSFLPSFGAAYLLPFDIARIDVARGVGRGGRWTFAFDVSREFWSIL